MPLPKRLVEPVHVARATIPDEYPLPSELEAVTNGTLANTVRQLSSLSRHAEDMFGELAREAGDLSQRASNLQARIDRLAIKVTQLDSTVEEVSLQDIHMRKAFKSQVMFDQQVVSRHSMPTAMMETYKTCDPPPPLDKLNSYREDGKDGMKFYTDPDYFFDLWRQEMLKDTERAMNDRGKKPHRPRNAESSGGRHKKRVRQPHNTRERQKEIAVGHGEYIMPQNVHYRTPQPVINPDEALLGDPRPPRPNSIELRRTYPDEDPYRAAAAAQGGAGYPPGYDELYSHHQGIYGSSMKYTNDYTDAAHNLTPNRNGMRPPTGGGGVGSRPSQPPPAPPSNTNSNSSTPTMTSLNNTPTRGRSMSAGRDGLPPPPPPPNDVTMSPPSQNGPILSHIPQANNPPRHHMIPTAIDAVQELPPPPPVPSPPVTAPPPPPLPPPMPNGPMSKSPPLLLSNGDVCKSPPLKMASNSSSPPQDISRKPSQTSAVLDPRNDLLKAIRDGIKLRKVEKSEAKEVERVNALHDVASILARRVAVEFSDSDSASESECESEGGWAEQETSA